MTTVRAAPLHPELRDVAKSADGYKARWQHLTFVVSDTVELDGKRWRHASVSRRDRAMPTYDDLVALKRVCIGEDRTALQVFPPKAKHIDIAGAFGVQVLHLWCCLDGDVTPDFTQGGNSI